MTSYQNTTVPQPEKSEMQKVSTNVGLQSSTVVKEVKSEGNHTDHQASKPIAVKEKVASLPANKKKAQGDKTCSSTGGLANLWGRVPIKSKLGDDHADVNRATAANPSGLLCLLVDFIQISRGLNMKYVNLEWHS